MNKRVGNTKRAKKGGAPSTVLPQPLLNKVKNYVKRNMRKYVSTSVQSVTHDEILDVARDLKLVGPMVDELKVELDKLDWVMEGDDMFAVIQRIISHSAHYQKGGKGYYNSTIYYKALEPIVSRAMDETLANITHKPLDDDVWDLLTPEHTGFMELMHNGYIINPHSIQFQVDDKLRLKILAIFFACWDKVKVLLGAYDEKEALHYEIIFKFIRLAMHVPEFVQKYYHDIHYVIINFINKTTKQLNELDYAAYSVFPTLGAMRQGIGKLLTTDVDVTAKKTLITALSKIYRNVETMYFKCLKKMAVNKPGGKYNDYIRFIYKCSKDTFLTSDEKDAQFKSIFEKHTTLTFTKSKRHDYACP